MPIAGLFEKGSRHVTLLGYKAVSFTNDSVTLDKPADGFGTTIEAAAIVLATASEYTYPATVDLPSIQAVRDSLVETQQEVAKAQHVLIVGGGAYGVEWASQPFIRVSDRSVAGEVADQYPRQKQITLVTSGSSLIGGPYTPKLGKSLASQLEQRGVRIIYDVRCLSVAPLIGRTASRRNFPPARPRSGR